MFLVLGFVDKVLFIFFFDLVGRYNDKCGCNLIFLDLFVYK